MISALTNPLRLAQVFALTNRSANPAAASPGAKLRVGLLSSMGTSVANPTPQMGGPILHWKLNAEAFLGSASGPALTTIAVKPGGLDSSHAGPKLLAAPSTDALLVSHQQGISRADVARTLVAALESDDPVLTGRSIRFDLGSTHGAATTDGELLPLIKDSALWPWQC